jgi:hypothetical protein
MTSNSRDMVVWTPPPIPFVVLNTRNAYRDYTNAIMQVFVYDSAMPGERPHMHSDGFDIIDHMGEIGTAINSIVSYKPLYDKKRDSVMGHNFPFMPDADGVQLLKSKLEKLIESVWIQCNQMQLYDGTGALQFAFYDWSMGDCVMGYMHRVFESPPQNHWLVNKC